MKKLYLIPDIMNLEESQKLAEEYNAGFEYNDFFLPEILEDVKKQTELIDAYAKVRGDFSEDTLHGAFLDVSIQSMDPLIREVSEQRVRQSMEIARNMSVRGIIFHTGRIRGFRREDYLKNWENRNEVFLRRLMEEYPQQEIWMENMFDESPDVLAHLADKLADCPNFGICLDYAHAVLYGGDPAEWLAMLLPYIRHIHINDNDLQQDLHLAMGKGQMDWKKYQKNVKEYAEEASVLVEVKGIGQQRESLCYMQEHHIFPFAESEGPEK